MATKDQLYIGQEVEYCSTFFILGGYHPGYVKKSGRTLVTIGRHKDIPSGISNRYPTQ